MTHLGPTEHLGDVGKRVALDIGKKEHSAFQRLQHLEVGKIARIMRITAVLHGVFGAAIRRRRSDRRRFDAKLAIERRM